MPIFEAKMVICTPSPSRVDIFGVLMSFYGFGTLYKNMDKLLTLYDRNGIWLGTGFCYGCQKRGIVMALPRYDGVNYCDDCLDHLSLEELTDDPPMLFDWKQEGF